MRAARALMWVSAVALSIIGLTALFSATESASVGIRGSFDSQCRMMAIAFLIALPLSRLRSGMILSLSGTAYLLCVAGLVLVLVQGTQVNNASSWIRIGGISIQPSEFIKLGIILVLARLLRHERHEQPFQELLLTLVLTGIPLILILRQPDLGTALVILPLVLVLCHTSGYSAPWLGLLVTAGTLLPVWIVFSEVFSWSFNPLHRYQAGRIIRLLHQDGASPLVSLGTIPWGTLAGIAMGLCLIALWRAKGWHKVVWTLLIMGHATPFILWSRLDIDEQHRMATALVQRHKDGRMAEEPQLLQAKFAMGNGSWRGQGWRQGEQTQYQRLPYSYSDLIFASIAEEWGFIGASTVLGLNLLITLCILFLSSRTREAFPRLALTGIACLFAVQALIHSGYTVGLLPMTGLTLPFISKGGSSVMVSWAAVGLAHALSKSPPHRALSAPWT
ncbi:MAG: FtsW/RodA/SpoVE family cell cycle protein [Planctomycetota bacterium]